MTFDESLEQALTSAERLREIRSLALHLFHQGHGPAAVLELFEQARQRLRQANRERDEDAVLEVTDFLVGWCSPHMRLTPNESTDGASGGPSAGPKANGDIISTAGTGNERAG
jgi:hypothetical protein